MTRKLYDLLQRPAPYAPSPSIWTDAHISRQMLKYHLDDTNDASSYRTAYRERICAYLYEAFGFAQETAAAPPALLDLGCGPGLYAQWFAGRGVAVTGVDFSANSIAYARAQAEASGLSIRYIQADYRDFEDTERYDAVMMVSEDLGVLAPADRHGLLCKAHALLRPGGHLALDVGTQAAWEALSEQGTWSAEPSGFYRQHPHVVLSKTYRYPQEVASCAVHVIVDDRGMDCFYVHQTYYTPDRIEAELAQAGFAVERVLGSLDGAPYVPGGRLMGILAVKR